MPGFVVKTLMGLICITECTNVLMAGSCQSKHQEMMIRLVIDITYL